MHVLLLSTPRLVSLGAQGHDNLIKKKNSGLSTVVSPFLFYLLINLGLHLKNFKDFLLLTKGAAFLNR